MTKKNAITQVTDNLMVTLDYTLTVDNQIIDSSKENGMIRFVQGSGEILPSLERKITGLTLGEPISITIPAKDGYGDFDEDRLIDIPRDEFPKNIPLELGVQLKMKDQDGNPLQARINEIADDYVKLNFNHILAGKDLLFDITVVDLREATAEELENGPAQ